MLAPSSSTASRLQTSRFGSGLGGCVRDPPVPRGMRSPQGLACQGGGCCRTSQGQDALAFCTRGAKSLSPPRSP